MGRAKAASAAEDAEAYLSLPLGARLERAVALSDAVLALRHAAGRTTRVADTTLDDDIAAWRRVHAKLHAKAGGGGRHG